MSEAQLPRSSRPSAKRAPRNETLDGLKYVAACAIVLHHVAARAGGPLGAFLTAAPVAFLFFFFAVSGYFHGAVGGRGTQWLAKRFVRLAIPYAVWSVVYLAWQQRQMLSGGPPFLPNPIEVIFVAGAHGLLWYLPMAFMCALFADVFVRSNRLRWVAIGLCVVAVLAIYWLGPLGAISVHRLQNFVYAPRWFLAYLGGMDIRARGALRLPAWRYQTALFGSMFVVGSLRLVSGRMIQPLSMTLDTALWIFGALVLLLGAVSGVSWYGTARLSWGRDYLLGIYLSQVIWLDALQMLLPPTSLPPVLWIPITWVACLLLATLTTKLLLSNRVSRWSVI